MGFVHSLVILEVFLVALEVVLNVPGMVLVVLCWAWSWWSWGWSWVLGVVLGLVLVVLGMVPVVLRVIHSAPCNPFELISSGSVKLHSLPYFWGWF